MSAYPCSHKDLKDHSRLDGSVRIWRCSFCGTEGRWSDGWSYWGNDECGVCWTARIDTVRCPNCAGIENGAHPPFRNVHLPVRERGGR